MIGLAHLWIAAVSGWSQAVTGSLVAAVWQGILLAMVAGLGLRLLPKTPAAVRFAIWFGVFLVVTALPVLSLWPHAAGAARTSGRGAWLVMDERWCLGIAAVWAAASLVRAGTLAAAAFRVRALWKRATPVEKFGRGEVNPTINARCARVDHGAPGFDGAGRRAQICTSEEVDRPTVIGFFSPKILIPAWLLEKLTAAELEQIVLHEAGHLGRADDWMNLLQKIALVVFPLNPALAWVERRLCFERELAVDERVLQALAGRAGAAKAYAACLATLAEYRLGRRALALALGALGRESHPSRQAGWGPRSELGRRVGRILRRGEGMKPLHSRLVLGGAMLGLLVAATGFERCPQVVSFSNESTQTAARDEQGRSTERVSTAVSERPFIALNVTYKASKKREIQPVISVTHEIVTMASDSSTRLSANFEGIDQVQRPVDRGSDGSARMMQTTVPVSSARNRSRTISDAVPAQPADVVMQWVVVTAWQDGQGTRMVFTTERTSSAARPAAADSTPTAGEQVRPSEQGSRYAAVPVRGGWIVFQL
jgi:hypothetical protein